MTAARQVPFLDLQAQHRQIRSEITSEVLRVIDSQNFILGEEVRKLESELADYCGARSAIGCASGSDALYLALLALGISRGDKVVTSPYTFFATAGAIARAGAIPLFADIEEQTFNIDVHQVSKLCRFDAGIRAILPVHLFGACADMDPLDRLAEELGIPLIEDAAQSIGAEYKSRRAGSLGRIGCFSFFPTKNLGAYGDGGMLTTSDASLAERLMALRVHGSTEKYLHPWIGINSRLDALQAVVLRVKLRYLDDWTRARQRNAALYCQWLSESALPVTLPAPATYQTRHVFNQFVIRGLRRDQLQSYLKEEGVGTEIYYPLPLHLQKCFADLGYREGDFPVSERVAREALALPIYPELPAEDLRYVCDRIQAFYRFRTCAS